MSSSDRLASASSRPAASRLGGRAAWLSLLAIVAATFAADRFGAAVLRWIIAQSDERFARLYAGGRTDDILILGTSVGNAMVLSPHLQAQTGLRSFSMAQQGTDAVTQDAVAQDYLIRNAAPSVALMDVRAVRVRRLRAPALRLFAPADSALAALDAARDVELIPWSTLFHLHAFNSPLLPKALAKIIERDDQAASASDGRINPAIIEAWRQRAARVEPSPASIAAFAATAARLSAAGARVISVEAPLHPVAWLQANEATDALRRALPSGVIHCDFSRLLTADAHFEDPTHLNASGRAAFLPYLAAAATAQVKDEVISLVAANISPNVQASVKASCFVPSSHNRPTRAATVEK
jgi:hypothetical protein